MVAAGEAEVVFGGFAETPHVPSGVAGHHLCRIIFSQPCQQKSDAANGAGRHVTQAIVVANEITRNRWPVFCCICRLLSARFASATDSPEKIRTLSGGGLCTGRDYKIFPHFASIPRASSGHSAEVGGNLSRHANGRVASMIALECEVTPRSLSSGEMRGSSAELQALRTMSMPPSPPQPLPTPHPSPAPLAHR